MHPSASRRRIAVLLLVLYLIALALIAFWPTPVDRGVDGELFHLIDRLRAAGLRWVSYDLIESSSNVLLFAPFGLLVGLLTGRGWRILGWAVCVSASLAIELGQAVLLPARYASAGDVAANSTGAAIGVLVVVAIEAIAARRAVLATRRTASASAVPFAAKLDRQRG